MGHDGDVNEERLWKLVATAVGVGIAMLVRRALKATWTRRAGGTPDNPADDDTTWRDAVVFAAISGIAVGVARLLSDRATAEAWRKAKGSYPPGIKDAEPALAQT